MRAVLTFLLPLLLPTLAYLSWLWLARRRARRAGATPPQWSGVPWSWLAVAGGLLAVLAVAAGVVMSDYSRKGAYHPARMDEQGRVVPGYFEK